jgi:predicted nucleotidyltransferase
MNQKGSAYESPVRKFTPDERKQALERLLKELDADPVVAGVMYAGSTSEGFRDDYSDIDLIVISRPEDFDSVVRKWVARIESMFPVISRFRGSEHERKVICCFLLEGFLELDVLFESLSTLSPRDRWKIAFDRTEQVGQILGGPSGEPEQPPLEAYYRACVDSIWYHVTHTVTALYRGHLWKALHEVDELRFRTLSLFGLLRRLNTDDYAEVDLLPPDILEALEKTLVVGMSRDAIFGALRVALDSFFRAAREVAERAEIEPPAKMESLLRKYLEASKSGALN